MNWTPSATRSDVVRMIRRYRETEFSIPSAAGKIAIDETRVVKRRDGASAVMDSSEVAAMSWVEFCDVVRHSVIRKAVTAPPERRTDVKGSEDWNSDYPLRCVAPRRAVAPIVKSRSTRSTTNADSDVRAWRDTVTAKLARIPREEEAALLGAEDLRVKLIETTNRLAAARSELQRATGGRKRSQDDQLSALVVTLFREDERRCLVELRDTVHSLHYSSGIDNLLTICTVTREVEEYVFRMAA